jgi:uncharacterized MnhB-related membrane protein
MLELAIDLFLAAGALALAGLALSARRVFTAIVLFVSLGLLVTLIWARLGAWDVAIAEAAIGAGLTSALLLAAWRKLDESKTNPVDGN